MKKYTMIFVSVILALVTLLIPNQRVKAASYLYLDEYYNDTNFSIDVYEVIDYLKTIEDDYYVNFTYSKQTGYFQVGIAKKNATIGNSGYNYYYHKNSTEQVYLRVNKGEYIKQDFKSNDFDTNFETFKNNISNSNFSSVTGAYALIGQSSPYINQIVLIYSNVDFVLSNDYDDLVYYNGVEIETNQVVPSYYDYMNQKKIDISSGYICDLEGKDAEYVTIDFNDYASEEYTYQYGIKRQAGVDYIKWYDISELNNYMYNFNEYYNGTIIYARVLDSQGKEIARNQYTINNAELPTFGLKITSGLACPIPNYDGDPQAEIINIDFSNAYDEDYKYYYYYDSRATKYEINVTSEQLTHQINEYLYNFIYFVIYDENDNLIYYAYGDVSTRLGFVPEDYETRHNIEISDGVACDLDGNKIINIKFDFSDITKYVNHYNFDVVINGEHFGSILYHEITLNEQNYIQDYDVKIYIDEFLYYSDSYRVGGILGEEGFEDTYNNMLNNGNWNEDLNVENVEDMGDLVIQFLGAISSFIATFFDLLDFFFQRLNFWIRACTITLFIELVICKIIKGVRK